MSKVVCDYCDGKGKQFEAFTMEVETCLYCHGTGKVEAQIDPRDATIVTLTAALSEAIGAILSAFRLAETRPDAGMFKLGDLVKKKSGSSWRGKVVGGYATDLTPRGYCVESANEPGSVQIYPEAALGEWEPEPADPDVIRAVAEEQEACAKIAEDDDGNFTWAGTAEGVAIRQQVARDIAAAIRARGEEK